MSPKKTEENGDNIPISKSLLNGFFQLILEGRLSEAERSLEEIEVKIKTEGSSEFNRGFLKALKGIILMHRSNDQYVFLSSLNPNNIDALKKYHQEFMREARKMLHGDYDRGYFLALAKYIYFMLKYAESSQKRALAEEKE